MGRGPVKRIVSLHVPKQLRHWCRLAGLSPECRKRRDSHYYTGHGRRWRLNCHGEWQMSGNDFDRWANSVAATIPLPRSELAFLAEMAGMQANAVLSGCGTETNTESGSDSPQSASAHS